MTRTWEYMVVVYTYTGNRSRSKAFYLWWPGQVTAEERNDEDHRQRYGEGYAWRYDEDHQWTSILSELGRDGWELISSVVLDSSLIRNTRCWGNSGVATKISHTFKRQLAGD